MSNTRPPFDCCVIIPCWNDSYTLGLALRSWVPFVKQVIVVDDHSTDGSAMVAESFNVRYGNVKVVRPCERLGNVGARNLGMDCATMEGHHRLIFVDSDSVFNGDLGMLAEVLRAPAFLEFHNLWGDLEHMQLLSSPGDPSKEVPWADVCQVFVDTRIQPDFRWHAHERFAMNNLRRELFRRTGLVLWHLQGVKPEERIVQREAGWWEAERSKFNRKPQALLDILRSKRLHRMAAPHPKMPAWLLEHQRFQLVYEDGLIVNRIDREKP